MHNNCHERKMYATIVTSQLISIKSKLEWRVSHLIDRTVGLTKLVNPSKPFFLSLFSPKLMHMTTTPIDLSLYTKIGVAGNRTNVKCQTFSSLVSDSYTVSKNYQSSYLRRYFHSLASFILSVVLQWPPFISLHLFRHITPHDLPLVS